MKYSKDINPLLITNVRILQITKNVMVKEIVHLMHAYVIQDIMVDYAHLAKLILIMQLKLLLNLLTILKLLLQMQPLQILQLVMQLLKLFNKLLLQLNSSIVLH
jgi:hypothetical protein